MNIAKSAFTAGVVGWLYGGLPAFASARKAFIETSHGEIFQNRAEAVVRARGMLGGALGTARRPGPREGALGGGVTPEPAEAGWPRVCGTRVFARFWCKKFAGSSQKVLLKCVKQPARSAAAGISGWLPVTQTARGQLGKRVLPYRESW